MKLYYLTGACSLATYISLLEAGQKFEAFSVDRTSKQTSDGKDYHSINPKGYVPTLVLDNGEVLTENTAVLSYVASLDPAGTLGPKPGTFAFYRLLEWLAYVNGEVHKNFGPLFRPTTSDEARAAAKEMIAKRLGYIEERLTGHFLMGDHFTVADAYLYVTLSWRSRVGVDISAFPRLVAFYERVRARPCVQQAFKAEGLSP